MSKNNIMIMMLCMLSTVAWAGEYEHEYEPEYSIPEPLFHDAFDSNQDTNPSASELRLAQDELQQRQMVRRKILVRKNDGTFLSGVQQKRLNFRQRMLIKFLARILVRVMDIIINQQKYLEKKVLPFTPFTAQELQILRNYLKNMTPRQTQQAINSLVMDRKQHYFTPTVSLQFKNKFATLNNAASNVMQNIDRDVALISQQQAVENQELLADQEKLEKQEMFNTEMIILNNVVSAALPSKQKMNVAFNAQEQVPEFIVR